MRQHTQDVIQEQLIQARRNQILDAATAVFAEQGFERATIRQVAKAAGIADGTIYIYFENKTALLLGILDRLNETERRDDDLAQMAELDLRRFIETYYQQRYAFLTKEGLDLFRAIMPEVLSNSEISNLYMQEIIGPTFALAEKHFARLVEDGRVRPLNVRLAIRVLSGTFLGLLTLRIMGDKVVESQWNELLAMLSMMFLDGIEPD